jgi:hypothetical protein
MLVPTNRTTEPDLAPAPSSPLSSGVSSVGKAQSGRRVPPPALGPSLE